MSVVLVFVFAVCFIYLIQTKYKVFLLGISIAGPWAVPLLGNVQMITKLKPEYLFLTITENRAKFRESFRLWLGPQLWVFLHSPAETRDALNDPTLVKADTFNQLNVLIGNGLLISHGKYWHRHRRALAPAFHPSILNSFCEPITQHAQTLVQKLRETAAQSIEVTNYLFSCILDVVIDTSMGKTLNSQHDVNCRYTHAFHSTSELLFKRMVNPLLAPDFIFKRTAHWKKLSESLQVIHVLMEAVIRERAEFLSLQRASDSDADIGSATSKRRRTLLDTLLTTEIDGRLLSLQEVRDEVNTFVFAGVDTTTAAMSFVLYALAKYPVEQSKVYEEIRRINTTSTAEEDQDQTNFSNQRLSQLVYLDMFIKECLRYYTIVPMTGRQTTTDTLIAGKSYCAGVTLWVNMYGLAHDDQLFEQPYEFRPERFSSMQELPAFSFIPFAGGPHVCIGRKYALLIIKVLTVKILQNFVVHLRDPEERLILMAQMVLKSLHGINLKFEQRC